VAAGETVATELGVAGRTEAVADGWAVC